MGTKYYQDYYDFVNLHLALNELEHLTRAQVNSIIDVSIARYSVDSPQRMALQVTGDGTYRYDLPADWDTDFSCITMIEYPDQQQEISQVRLAKFQVHDDGSVDGEQIHFLEDTPSSSETFTVHYLIKHSVTETTSTVPDADFEAVGYLVVSRVCLSLAGRMLRNRDSRQSVDVVSFRTLSDEYRGMAKEYFEMYKQEMGLPDKGPRPAGVMSDLEVTPPWIIGGYLTHGRR